MLTIYIEVEIFIISSCYIYSSTYILACVRHLKEKDTIVCAPLSDRWPITRFRNRLNHQSSLCSTAPLLVAFRTPVSFFFLMKISSMLLTMHLPRNSTVHCSKGSRLLPVIFCAIPPRRHNTQTRIKDAPQLAWCAAFVHQSKSPHE